MTECKNDSYVALVHDAYPANGSCMGKDFCLPGLISIISLIPNQY
jgi:hypothetical protein